MTLSHFADSNRRPTHYECVALPTELKWHCGVDVKCLESGLSRTGKSFGRGEKTRTSGLHVPNVAPTALHPAVVSWQGLEPWTH